VYFGFSPSAPAAFPAVSSLRLNEGLPISAATRPVIIEIPTPSVGDQWDNYDVCSICPAEDLADWNGIAHRPTTSSSSAGAHAC
jgi:hypothetical protein